MIDQTITKKIFDIKMENYFYREDYVLDESRKSDSSRKELWDSK